MCSYHLDCVKKKRKKKGTLERKINGRKTFRFNPMTKRRQMSANGGRLYQEWHEVWVSSIRIML